MKAVVIVEQGCAIHLVAVPKPKDGWVLVKSKPLLYIPLTGNTSMEGLLIQAVASGAITQRRQRNRWESGQVQERRPHRWHCARLVSSSTKLTCKHVEPAPDRS